MRLQQLILEQYRNYPNLNLEFEPQGVTTIIGPNAQGKTNILEAIYLLALTKSFRTSKQHDLIQWEKEYARVQGYFVAEDTKDTEDASETMQLEIFLGQAPHPSKVLKKNEVKISSAQFIGNCQMVFFHPEDLNMLYLGPDLRRRFLDLVGIQINPPYYRALQAYKRIIEQRNAALKRLKEGRTSQDELELWDERLLEQGTFIITERSKLLQFLRENITAEYRNIAQTTDHISLLYHASIETQPIETILPLETVQKLFSERLSQVRPKDLQYEYTTVGPHRDDFQILLNNRALQSHASRGEYRSLLLALKQLELKYYEKIMGKKALLLLDDVFSELDVTRQHMLLQTIQQYQTVLTTAHLPETIDIPGQRVQLPLY